MSNVSKCDFCGRPAATFLQHVVDGESKKVAMCNECMQEHGIDVTQLDTVLKAFEIGCSEFRKEQLEEKCVCGTTGEVAGNGLAGCEQCYVRFRELLDAVWGVDSGEPTMPVPGTERQQLEARLADAVEYEKYEEAAALRDQMKMLETEDVDETEA